MEYRIVHIAPLGSSLASGLMHSVPSLMRNLHPLGVQTALISSQVGQRYTENQPFPVFHWQDKNYLPTLDILPPPFNQPHLLVFHSVYDNRFIPIHALLANQAKRRGIPYILTPRGELTQGAQKIQALKKRVANSLFGRRMIRNAAAIHCLTENEAKDTRAWHSDVFVVGNGIEVPEAPFSPSATKTSGLCFVFIGRLDINHKGLDLLVNACNLIQESLRSANAQVHLYGPDANNSKTILQQMCIEHQIQDIVHFHEPVYGDDKLTVLQNADVFIHTSRFEGHPMSVLEALSYGIPCLLTPGTNIANVVAEAKAGWEVDPDPISISNRIRTILEKPSVLQEVRPAAYQLAKTEFSWEKIACQTLNEYIRYMNIE